MTTPRNLDSIDEIRRTLSPERLARRGETAQSLAGTRLRVDGKPCMIYPVPTDTDTAIKLVRLARRTAVILATIPNRNPEQRSLMTTEQRHARTRANLDRLHASARIAAGPTRSRAIHGCKW